VSYAREKRLLLGWLALIAPVPLPFNGILEWPILIAFMGACLLFLRRAARDPGGWLPVWAMNLLAIAYTPYFLFDLTVLSRGRLVVAVTHLLLFAVLVKLFAIRRERDKWQAAVAVFFVFLTAMGTSVHPTVVLYLVLFLGLTLLVFARFAQLHLMAAFAATEEQRRTLLSVPMRGFLTVSTLVALILAVPLFALLPRVESPFVPGRGQGLGTLGAATGFSDVVTLDSIGRIRTNREVAMRLRYEGEVPPGHELRYKGGAFTQYRNGTWNRGRIGDWRPIRPSRRGDEAFRLAPGEPEAWVEVFLRPVVGRNVLLPSEAVQLEADASVMSMDDRGVLTRVGPVSEAFEYRVGLAGEPVSRSPPPYGPTGSESREAATLGLSGVTPEIAELAAEVAGGGEMADQARRIEEFLTTEFEYSLDFVGDRGRDPLRHFLFERREGHCEYFATAMVLMLRSRGIPARLATGFLGGELNPLEGYYVVRQSNAHAWVEAYLPENGWTTFDPTPPGGRPALSEAGLGQVFAQAWDYVLFRWDRYVLTYGFGDQMQVLFFLRSAWTEIKSWFADDGEDAPAGEPVVIEGAEPAGPEAAEGPERGLSRWFLLVPALGLVALLAFLWRRLRRPLTGPDAYRRLRRSAARAGLSFGAHEPPLEFSRRFARRFPAAATSGAEVMRLYVRESWAEEELAEEERERMARALREARAAMRN
jgi:transglutaminase-like putative cysteine protease